MDYWPSTATRIGQEVQSCGKDLLGKLPLGKASGKVQHLIEELDQVSYKLVLFSWQDQQTEIQDEEQGQGQTQNHGAQGYGTQIPGSGDLTEHQGSGDQTEYLESGDQTEDQSFLNQIQELVFSRVLFYSVHCPPENKKINNVKSKIKIALLNIFSYLNKLWLF